MRTLSSWTIFHWRRPRSFIILIRTAASIANCSSSMLRKTVFGSLMMRFRRIWCTPQLPSRISATWSMTALTGCVHCPPCATSSAATPPSALRRSRSSSSRISRRRTISPLTARCRRFSVPLPLRSATPKPKSWNGISIPSFSARAATVYRAPQRSISPKMWEN